MNQTDETHGGFTLLFSFSRVLGGGYKINQSTLGDIRDSKGF